MHEEHLIYYIDVPLVNGQNRYPIPSRAHGDKIRDVAYIDNSGNVYEMFRYSIDDISDFSNSYNNLLNTGFYLQNNDIVLLSQQDNGYRGFLRMYFYMRPNKLVLEERGAAIAGILNQYEIDALNPQSGTITNISVANPTIITSTNHGLVGGEVVSFTGTNSTPLVTGNYTVNYIDENTFSVDLNVTIAGNSGTWSKMILVNTLSFSQFPENFIQDSLYDIVQNISPNKIVHYDVKCNSINSTTKTISLVSSETSEIKVGSYVTLAEESIVPNIPTELHPLLAQRVAVYCLEAMGDEQNKQSAERMLKEMEMNANTFLDNRVEGALQKIKARHSPLTQSLNTLGRRNRRW
jgi:hypothetical protein